MKRRIAVLAAAFGLLTLPAAAFAWHLDGRVYCEGTNLTFAGIEIRVVSQNLDPVFVGSATSDENGFYHIDLPEDPACFRATALVSGSESVVSPAAGYVDFCTTDSDFEITRDWVIASPACAEERCWLTGGGAKFSNITGDYVAETGRRHNFGGNVNPGCSPTAGEGGQWNHIEEALKLHFQGFQIQVVRCGNVEGIPPGSESPVTPFNFIEFKGTGRVKGIKGNKADYPLVYFFARCEDRNEPGSNGQRDGALKDRYFLHVYTNPADPTGSTLILVDENCSPASVDPLAITDGNLQIHVSSCETPPLLGLVSSKGARLAPRPVETPMPENLFLTRLGSQPDAGSTILRFGLPRDADVSLRVFDVTGRTVRDLVSARMPSGTHAATWDFRTSDGRRAPGGIYFVRLAVEGQSLTQRVFVR